MRGALVLDLAASNGHSDAQPGLLVLNQIIGGRGALSAVRGASDGLETGAAE